MLQEVNGRMLHLSYEHKAPDAIANNLRSGYSLLLSYGQCTDGRVVALKRQQLTGDDKRCLLISYNLAREFT